ncbi:MAG: aldo/keto reductase [Ignavibacterium sp.]|nr:aldo/keto reductase [Ignavibacterium sp.]MDW8375981.1 aldo/keto reductase [Ignavibacteriales bacterium]
MKYKLFGRSGLRVSELALGTMTFGEEWGWGSSKEESKEIFDLYANAGGNFIDTANRYTEGTSEKFVGEFISSDRDHFIVATKYTLFTRMNDPNFCGNHRKNMVRSLEESLKRLNTDYIDLYWLHAWDYTTPVDEILRGLDDLIRQGKILYIGISDTPAWIVSHANTLAELQGWTRFVGLQIKYSLLDRTAELDLLPMARYFNLAVTPWSVVGGGILTGKYSKDSRPQDGRSTVIPIIKEKDLQIAEVVKQVADEIGCTPSQVALNWVRKQRGTIIPIIGARKIDQLKENLACLEFDLSDQHIEKLNNVSAIDYTFPHSFYNNPRMRELIYGGTESQILSIDSLR